MSELATVSFEKDSYAELLKTNLDFFGGTALPDVCTEHFAPLHQNIWELLTQACSSDVDEFLRFAIGLPRGHAKTQLLKLLVVWIIAYTDRQFILVVCNTATNAQNFIEDVCGILSEQNIVETYGDWQADVDKDNDKVTQFFFNGRKVILKPMGIGSSLRGANINNRRPEIIIGDDAQDRDSAMSPEIARKQLQWFLGTLLKARSYKRCTVIYVGNMYPDVEIGERGSGVYGCILRNLQLSNVWRSWITGAIQDDGTVLWPQVQPLDMLLDDLEQDSSMGEEDIWWAEVQNDPSPNINKLIDFDKIPEYPYTDNDVVVGKFIMIDPSMGKDTSDNQIAMLFYVYDNLGPVARKFKTLQNDPPTVVKEVIQWALEERVPLVCAENYAYQASLLSWFVFVMDNIQVQHHDIKFVGVNRGSRSGGNTKNTAITASFKSIMRGSLILHNDVLVPYKAEAKLFDPLKQKNMDDILDTTEYGERIYRDYQSEYLLDSMLLDDKSNGITDATKVDDDFDPATHDFSGGTY
tara:strand:- start:258 stop:1826 length:1569 start_codon:yes stop_codon:yes gene_type:complete